MREFGVSNFTPSQLRALADRDDVATVGFPYFGGIVHEQFQHNEQSDVLERKVPVKRIELADGRKGAVQALGDSFGHFDGPPFVQLSADDRTGQSADGEWLRINGTHWDQIRRVLVYCFIYEGAPNWAATDGVVTVYAPDQPPIEVRLDETSNMGMCAVTLLENVGGQMRVQREVRYFQNHKPMDEAFGWGVIARLAPGSGLLE